MTINYFSNLLKVLMVYKKFLYIAFFSFCIACTSYENISRPALLGDFRIYTTSGKEIVLKSSKISADADKVQILSHYGNFRVGDIQYFIIRASYYEDAAHFFVNSNNGKTIYVNDFHEAINTKKDEAFVVTVGNEAYSADSGIAIFSIDAEGNFIEKFRIKGLFDEVSKIITDNKGGFKFKSKQMDTTKTFENRYVGDVLISYKDGKFTQQKVDERKLN